MSELMGEDDLLQWLLPVVDHLSFTGPPVEFMGDLDRVRESIASLETSYRQEGFRVPSFEFDDDPVGYLKAWLALVARKRLAQLTYERPDSDPPPTLH